MPKNKIFSEEMGLRIEGDSEVLKDVVESIREAFDKAGMDMPKRLHDCVFSLESQLGILE